MFYFVIICTTCGYWLWDYCELFLLVIEDITSQWRALCYSCGVVIRNWSLFLYKCSLVACMLCGLMESMLYRVRVRIVVWSWTVLSGANTKYTSQFWECSFDSVELLQACCCIVNEVFLLHQSLACLKEFRWNLEFASINFWLETSTYVEDDCAWE